MAAGSSVGAEAPRVVRPGAMPGGGGSLAKAMATLGMGLDVGAVAGMLVVAVLAVPAA